jgi:hypothetical protein
MARHTTARSKAKSETAKTKRNLKGSPKGKSKGNPKGSSKGSAKPRAPSRPLARKDVVEREGERKGERKALFGTEGRERLVGLLYRLEVHLAVVKANVLRALQRDEHVPFHVLRELGELTRTSREIAKLITERKRELMASGTSSGTISGTIGGTTTRTKGRDER